MRLPWLLAVFLFGCDGSLGRDDGHLSADGGTRCGEPCGACGANDACIGERANALYQPTCLRRCGSTDDCAPGDHCVNLAGEATQVCVNASRPALCEGAPATCPSSAPPACAAARTLALDYAPLCGRELVTCATGCEQKVTDAGVIAHCL